MGKCPLAPEELSPEALRLEFAPDKPLPPDPKGQAVTRRNLDLEKALTHDRNQATSSSQPPGSLTFGGDEVNGWPRLSLVGVMAFAAYSDSHRPQAGGHNPDRDGFTLQQVELAVESTVDASFKTAAFVQVDQIGAKIAEAYATTLGLPGDFELRVGKYNTAFGRANQQHLHAWWFADQPLLVSRFLGSDHLSPLGTELSWRAPLPFYLRLTGNVHNAQAIGQGGFYSGQASADVTSRENRSRLTFGADRTWDLLYVARAEGRSSLSKAWSVSMGFSGATGPSGTGVGQRAELYGADLWVHYQPGNGTHPLDLVWQTEGLWRRRQFPGNLLSDFGLYSELALWVGAHWVCAARADWLDGVSVIGEDPFGPGEHRRENRGSVSVAFLPNEFSVVRLQYEAQQPRWLHRDNFVHAVFLQLTTGTGAHAAR